MIVDPEGRDEVERLRFLAGRGPAPDLVPSTQVGAADHSVMVRIGAQATSADLGHPMGPEALADALASSLVALHSLSVEECPFSANTATLRAVVERRIADDVIPVAADGPYAGRSASALARVFDDLAAALGEPEDPVFIHAGLTPARVWLDPGGDVSLLGWQHSGVGDRHVDLAAAASMLTRLHGPALVAPFLQAYGFDRVDVRRLDAAQLLAHLLE